MPKRAIVLVAALAALMGSALTSAAQTPPSTKASVTVDFSQKQGNIRAINGVNLAPPLYAQKAGRDLDSFYKALKAPLARLHDAPLDNPGMRIVDVQHIFGNWNASADDPNSYYFEQTDDYIRNCKELGTDILYRLGTSIEHSKRPYYANPPKDYQKWTDICIHIIRHYNEGWAQGHEWNIVYWEIWNEPDVRPNMWTGSTEDYLRLYVTAATQIKKRFPKVKVGGPALAGIHKDFTEPFLERCRKENAPLDFFSWHCYTADLDGLIRQPKTVRELLDKHGFTQTELHLNEWHYFPSNFGKLRSDPLYHQAMFDGPDGLNGIDGAAFITSALTAWQDTPLTMGNYYTGTLIWGLFQRDHAFPYKTYYACRAFGQMLDCGGRVGAVSDDKSIRVLAGVGDKGAKAVLISAFKSPATEIQINLAHAEGMSAKVSRLDRENDWAQIAAEFKDGKIVLGKPAGSAVFLIELQ